MNIIIIAGPNGAGKSTTATALKSYLPWLIKLKSQGYRIDLIYLWLRSAEEAVEWVIERVNMGGHNVEESIIRRRYNRSLNNFFFKVIDITLTGGVSTITRVMHLT